MLIDFVKMVFFKINFLKISFNFFIFAFYCFMSLCRVLLSLCHICIFAKKIFEVSHERFKKKNYLQDIECSSFLKTTGKSFLVLFQLSLLSTKWRLFTHSYFKLLDLTNQLSLLFIKVGNKLLMHR